jgi:tetratricopeptide (TPR) repeat protein
LDIAYKMNDWMGAANRLNNLGNIESVKENYTAAERYFLQSIEYADKLKTKKPRLNAMANLARIYLEIDRVSEAQKMAQDAIVIAEELNDRDVLSKLYNTLTKSYEKQKDFSKALVYQQRKTKIQDSILNEKSLAKIQELQVRYETEKKESQIRELNRKNQIQALEIQERNLWMALFGVSLFGAVLLTAFYARQRILKQQNQVLAINQKLLRTQINPHFFFNVLSSIQAFMLEKQDSAPAVSYLSKFGKLMRSVLENSRVDFIPLSEEITTLQNYLDIQKIRFGDKFDYQINVENSIETEQLGIPPMLAQPFLENALEHGIKPLSNKGRIDVLFRPEKNGIVLNITDNGIGRIKASELTSESERQSLATQITQERIAVLNQQHKAKIDFTIEDVLDSAHQIAGTRVIFHLPLISV